MSDTGIVDVRKCLLNKIKILNGIRAQPLIGKLWHGIIDLSADNAIIFLWLLLRSYLRRSAHTVIDRVEKSLADTHGFIPETLILVATAAIGHDPDREFRLTLDRLLADADIFQLGNHKSDVGNRGIPPHP